MEDFLLMRKKDTIQIHTYHTIQKSRRNNMNKILVVEDEIAIADLIVLGLSQAGYKCEYALDGKKGADLIEANDYDLILLDIMLPEIDGYDLLNYAMSVGIPAIFITAKGQTKDKIKGLHMGADDYIAKPFEIEELLARVESVLRRYQKGSQEIKVGDVCVQVNSRNVTKNGESIELTPKEFELLLLFIQNRNIALYRDRIFEKVWGDNFEVETRTLDLHVQRLRKKLDWKEKIKTVYKVGYMLEMT